MSEIIPIIRIIFWYWRLSFNDSFLDNEVRKAIKIWILWLVQCLQLNNNNCIQSTIDDNDKISNGQPVHNGMTTLMMTTMCLWSFDINCQSMLLYASYNILSLLSSTPNIKTEDYPFSNLAKSTESIVEKLLLALSQWNSRLIIYDWAADCQGCCWATFSSLIWSVKTSEPQSIKQ